VRGPDANVGVVTGAVSGVVVLDADGPEGLASLKALNTPATTWLARTGKGLHQWFAHPGVAIGNRAGLRPHLDVRGDGGYVIAPPSLHASGRRYEWLMPPGRTEPAPLPENVLALLTAPGPATPAAGVGIPQGQRNDTLYRLARSLIQRGLSPGALHLAVAEQNRTLGRPPLPDREVRELVEHALLQPHRSDFRVPTAVPTITTSEGLGLVPIGDLLGEPAEAHTWIVEKRLPAGGLGLFAGKPKAGKSTAARCLALSVARGMPWLGFATTKGPVIYLALEEKRAEVRDHFRCLGAAALDQILVLCAAAPQDGLERLRREAERWQPVLIIIDPLFRFVRVEDGNDYATMTAALEPLLVLARETGACVLLVHHLGKGDRNDGDNVLGSTAIFGAVDSALLMKRTERYRTLSSIQRYGDDLEEITLSLDPETRNVMAGLPRAAAEQGDAEGLILRFLTGRQPVTEAEIDEAVECRTKPKRAALRALVEATKVARTGRGGKADPFRYALPGTTIAPERLL
jgi:hypothetical protein